MTKRFTVKDDVGMLDVACANIFDNGEFIGTVPLFDVEKFVDLLNELHEENEQLKKSIDCQNKTIKEQCMKIDWASECGVKWDKEFKNWRGYE